MNKRLSKVLALLVVFCLFAAFIPADTFAAAGDGVFWSASITDTMVSKNVLIGSPKSLSALGLSPRAIKDGSTSYSFTWTSSNTSVATVNASTGYVNGVSTGTAIITGYSSKYSSSLGQLTLIVFVSDRLMGATYLGVAGNANVCSEHHTNTYYAVYDRFGVMGYNPYGLYTSATSGEFAARVATSRMFCFRNHGTQTSLYLNNTSRIRVYTDFINTLPINSFDYCEIAIIASEYSGRGRSGSNNIVNALHSRGVDVVVGISTNATCEELDLWIEGMIMYLSQGYTVEQACIENAAELNAFYGEDGIYKHTCTFECQSGCTGYGSYNYYIAGDANATFH